MTDIQQLRDDLEGQSPRAILKAALNKYDNIAISFSGAEDVVLIEMAHRLTDNLQVFTLDTGRLHPETYEFIERVRKHYGINIEVLFPDSAEVQDLVNRKGLFSFFEDGHSECCGIRKVNPLRRKLATVDAWITGQRKDQSPGTRNDVPVIQEDTAFSTESKTLIKFNPLANWTSKKCGTTSGCRKRPTTSCMRKDLSVLAASPARALSCRASMNAKDVGGGKKRPRRNAGCTPVT